MPCTKSDLIATVNWFTNCLNNATSPETQVTMVVDLDELLITSGELTRFSDGRKPEKFSTPIDGLFFVGTTPWRYYADSHAFSIVRGVQERGHRIFVVTSGAYKFEVIQRLFRRFEIILTQSHYHNGYNIVEIGLRQHEKAEYIAAKPGVFSQQCMLFDDQKMNCPTGPCLFTHVDASLTFPSFKNLQQDALNSLLYDIPRNDSFFSPYLSDGELALIDERDIHPETWQGLQRLFGQREVREIFGHQDCARVIRSETPFETFCQLIIELAAMKISKICLEKNALVVKLRELKDSQKITLQKIRECLKIIEEYTAASFSNRLYTFFCMGNFEIDLIREKIAPYLKVLPTLATLLDISNQQKVHTAAADVF